jgi:hypothetical protein
VATGHPAVCRGCRLRAERTVSLACGCKE